MDDSIGTIIYIVLLVVILVAGGLSKKKKRPESPGSEARKKTSPGATLLEALLKGTGLPTEITETVTEENEEVYPVPDIPEEIPVVDREEKKPSWLPGEEGRSAFQKSEEVAEDIKTQEEDLYGEEDMIFHFDEKKQPSGFLRELLKDFDARKAVIYAEIMNTKYF